MEDQSYKKESGSDVYSGDDSGGYSEDVRVIFGDQGI